VSLNILEYPQTQVPGSNSAQASYLDLMTSVFQRLQRYQRTPGRDAREDRLTEALAVTLEAAPEAARHLVEDHFSVSPAGSGQVATQVPRPGLRADLELCFGRPTQPEVLIWFEAKVDSRAYREQGERYMQELERLAPGRWRFTWLMRGEGEVEGGLPDGAKCLTWQGLAASLRGWLREEGGSLDWHGPRLVSEFLDHLEREERLAFTERLEKTDAAVLGAYDVARGRLDELLRQARTVLEKEWGRLDPVGENGWPQRRSPQLPDFHLRLTREGKTGDSAWPKNCWFEWHGRTDDAREHPEGAWILGAGATFQVTEAPSEAEFREWFESIRRERFEYGQGGWKNDFRYIFRYLTLEELAEVCDGEDVATQARQLAEWVINALTKLKDFGPPTPEPSESGERGRTDAGT